MVKDKKLKFEIQHIPLLLLLCILIFLVNNPCLNSNCSHLCLLKQNNDYECACPENTNFLESDIFTCDAGNSKINIINIIFFISN